MSKPEKNKPVQYTNLRLPVSVVNHLKQWKLSYELAWSDPSPDGEQFSISYGEMLERWMDNVYLFDPDVAATDAAGEEQRAKMDRYLASWLLDNRSYLRDILGLVGKDGPEKEREA